jgi:hypothetical protein
MNLHLRAIRKTAGMLAIAFLIPTAITACFSLDNLTAGYMLLSVFFLFAVWILYSINLGQIKYESQIAEMQQRRD